MFSYDHLHIRYEPFPIGLAKPIMDENLYVTLLADWPPTELFAYFPKVGNKYSLSERFNSQHYKRFIESRRHWRALHEWIKSDAFVNDVIDTLKAHHIDIGERVQARGLKPLFKHLRKGRLPPRLRARFEFSMLPAKGGYVIPHTDAPSKLITLVISMVGEGEWNPAVGGGTDVNRPLDMRLSYNQINRQADFSEMEILDTYAFTPNQAVVFVKTFNSWHSVRPMTGADEGLMRKSLTINIEKR